jgi:phosphocarrier protein HPr
VAVRDVTIINRLGMHARPAMQFVETANRFPCQVTVSRGATKVNGKSIMEMMLLEAVQGTVLRLEADGGEAAACLDALEKLVADKFYE